MKNLLVLVGGLALAFLIGTAAPYLGYLLPTSSEMSEVKIDWSNAREMTPVEVQQRFSMSDTPEVKIDWSNAREMTPAEIQQRLSVPMGTPISPAVHKERCTPTTPTFYCEGKQMDAIECYESWVNGNRNHIACYCAQRRPILIARVTALIAREQGNDDADRFVNLIERWRKERKTDYHKV